MSNRGDLMVAEHNCSYEHWFDNHNNQHVRLEDKVDKIYDVVNLIQTEVQIQKNTSAMFQQALKGCMDVQDRTQKRITKLEEEWIFNIGKATGLGMAGGAMVFVFGWLIKFFK